MGIRNPSHHKRLAPHSLGKLFHLRRSHRRHAFPAAEIDSIPECAGINVSVSSDHTNEPDAQRRLIFITDLFPSMANALITSVSKHQAPALREALYKHLAAEASVGVTFPNKGFLTFRLSFHIPFFTLTSSQTRLDDQREVRGSPLRHTEDISFLSGSSGTEARRLLHEGHITCVIAGLDDEDWTAYLFIDTYFDGEDGENALAYQRNDTEHGMNEDPLTCGNHDADNPVCNPRRYFLDVLYYRLLQVKEEWQKVVEEVEVSFGQYERSPRHLLSRPDRPDDQEGVLADDQDSRREFDRVLQTMRLTTKLRARLTKTIDAFEAPRCDSLFGLLRELNQTESDLCHGSLPGIEASVGELKRLKKSLDSILDLGSQLGKIHGVILNLGALDETREQSKMAQKNGRFSGTMMASLPVALTTSVFSMQKIPLPLVRYSFGWFVGLIIMFSVLGTGLHYTQPMLQRRLATMAARQKPSFPKFNLPHFGRRPPLPGNDLERGDSQSLAPTNQADRQIVAIQPRRTTTFDSIATTLRPENPSAH
ncbi:hypothetical protein H2200_002849 [Cladophialophora chaetospira]|uniref:Uncharacterized protein n=1 Tax=Cladophialophora chaetospira TaxID=386627 RepID=A0AA38XG84_9EURO|nr:hypothetical protein H2200_002849 [Cladophialophora chaetospira]